MIPIEELKHSVAEGAVPMILGLLMIPIEELKPAYARLVLLDALLLMIPIEELKPIF